MDRIEFFNGDLIRDSTVDVICHQVNCQGVMGKGIAKQIHATYPRVYHYYHQTCSDAFKYNISPLGSCQLVYTDDTKSRIVANLFGQYYYGTNRRQTNYNALRNALHILSNNRFLRKHSYTLGFPYLIGCALGGGDWNIMLPMIEEELSDYPGTVEVWELGK